MGHCKVFGKLEKIKQNDEKSIQKLRITLTPLLEFYLTKKLIFMYLSILKYNRNYLN